MKRNINLLSLFILLLFSITSLQAARIDSVKVYSQKSNQYIKVLIFIPETKNPKPTWYLLHGYGGNEKSWYNHRKDLPSLADQYQMIIVCPDAQNSWYWDSPLDKNSQYETFMSKELIQYIDEHYSTVADNKHRAISGLSMGGHGAMYLAFRHVDIYGCATSMSGGVDIIPFSQNWEMKKQLGTLENNRLRWNKSSAISNMNRIKDEDLSLMIDCGDKDFFFAVNRAFHNKLTARNIKHDYIIRPGNHNWNYWCNALDFHIVFVNHFFK